MWPGSAATSTLATSTADDQAPHHSCSVEATTATTHHPSDSPAFDHAEDLAVAAAPKESGASSSGSSSGTVTIDGLLQLWPRQLEADCWRSPDAVRLLHALDCVCLGNSLFVAFLLVVMLGSPMTALEAVQASGYGVLAALQLLFMHTNRELYQRHRFKITVVNRLLRLGTVLAASADYNAALLSRWHTGVPQVSTASSWWRLLQQTLGVPFFYVNHANFILPFAYVLAAQLVTFGAVASTLGVTTCFMFTRPGTPQAAQQLCQVLKVTMHYLGFLPGRAPKDAVAAAAQECLGLQGFLLPCLYFCVVILLAGPCLFVYFVELRLKMGFIRQQRLTLQHAPPCFDSRLGRWVAIYAAVVGGWLACEVAVLVASPMQCSSAGALLLAPWLFSGIPASA